MGIDSKKLLAGAGIVTAGLAAVGAVSHVMTRELVSIAVDRECPVEISARTRERFTGTKENGDFLRAVARGAEKLRSRNTQTVKLTAADGAELVGHWDPSEQPRRVVIAMHGWRSSWAEGFGMISDFLRSSGCSVLYAEQRGQGSSGGAYMGLGALERYDCLDWIRYAVDGSGELPVYLSGISMGATTVLMAAGLELPSQVHGIIADCGFTSPHEIGRHVVENNLHLPYRLRAGAADALCKKKNQAGIRNCCTKEALRNNRIPVLFIHGADDCFVPISMTYENYKACSGPKELLVIPGADHAMCYYTDKPRYEAALKAFWKRYDCS